jgi:hypothetical protein
MLKHIIIAVCGLAFAAAGSAKLPAPTPEQQAAATLNAAKAAHAGKVDAYTLCMSQTKVAEAYIKDQKAAGRGGPAAACSGARCHGATRRASRQEIAVDHVQAEAPYGALLFFSAFPDCRRAAT